MEKYMLPLIGFDMKNWTVDAFESQEEAFKEYQKDSATPYCFGITFNAFDAAKDDYEVEFHFAKD